MQLLSNENESHFSPVPRRIGNETMFLMRGVSTFAGLWEQTSKRHWAAEKTGRPVKICAYPCVWVWASWSTHNVCDSIVLASVGKWRTKYLETTPLGNMQSAHFYCCGNMNPNLQLTNHHGNIVCVAPHIFSGGYAGCVCACVFDSLLLNITIVVLW